MSKKKKPTVELRYYEIPMNEPVLALLGEKWIRSYGENIINAHFHNLTEVGYCRYGEGQLVWDGIEMPYKSGTFCIIPPNYPHTTNSAKGTKSYWEYFYFDVETVLADMIENNMVLKEQMLHCVNEKPILCSNETVGNDLLKSAVLLILEEMRRKDKMYRLSVSGLLSTLAVEMFRMNEARSERQIELLSDGHGSGLSLIQNALTYIEKKYMEPLKVENLADVCGLSETHFRRLFVAAINMSPMEYVNLVRIQAACELMVKTEYSMDEVAQQVGFVTTSTFNRNFKRVLSTSPYQWKKNPENYESKMLNFKITALKGWD